MLGVINIVDVVFSVLSAMAYGRLWDALAVAAACRGGGAVVPVGVLMDCMPYLIVKSSSFLVEVKLTICFVFANMVAKVVIICVTICLFGHYFCRSANFLFRGPLGPARNHRCKQKDRSLRF